MQTQTQAGRVFAIKIYNEHADERDVRLHDQAITGRQLMQALGIHDVVAKSMGSSNPYNMVRATFDALKSQLHPKDVAAQRGIKYSTLQARRGAAVAADE